MENSNKSPMNTAMRYGLIGGLVLIVYGLILHLAGIKTRSALQWIGYLFLIAAIIMGTKAHRDQDLGGIMSYGRGLGIGTLTALFAGLLAAIFTYVFLAFISPDTISEVLREIEKGLLESRSEAEVEEIMRAQRMMANPAAWAGWGLLAYVFIGFIASLVVSAIFQKKPAVQ